MSDITFSVPGEALRALKLPADQCGAELRLAAAAKLYELGRLSSGAAAKLAGIPRALFLTKFADCGVPTFTVSEDELKREVALE